MKREKNLLSPNATTEDDGMSPERQYEIKFCFVFVTVLFDIQRILHGGFHCKVTAPLLSLSDDSDRVLLDRELPRKEFCLTQIFFRKI